MGLCLQQREPCQWVFGTCGEKQGIDPQPQSFHFEVCCRDGAWEEAWKQRKTKKHLDSQGEKYRFWLMLSELDRIWY